MKANKTAIGNWISALWANDYHRYFLMSTQPEVLNFRRLDATSLEVEFQFWDDQSYVTDDQTNFLFDIKYQDEYGVNFPAALSHVRQIARYKWETADDCESLSDKLVDEECVDQEVKCYDWNSKEIPENLLIDYEEGVDRDSMRNMLINEYAADKALPDIIPDRLIPFFKEIVGSKPSTRSIEVETQNEHSDAQSHRVKVVTGKVRFEHLKLQVPESSVLILIDKKDQETLNRVKSAIVELKNYAKENFGADANKFPDLVIDGDDISNGHPGCYLLEAKSQQMPGIVDINLNPVVDPSVLSLGFCGRVSITFYLGQSDGDGYVKCKLNNIQILN